MRRLRAVRDRGDDGQLILLVLIYAVIAGLLVTVVVNLSKAYLYRRSLVAAADGAALTAANQPDLERVYTGAGPCCRCPSRVPGRPSPSTSRDADLEGRFDGFRVVDVSTDGQTVTVTLAAVVRMPFLNLLTTDVRGGYPLDATARARSPLTP